MKIKCISIILFSLSLLSCSNKQIYENIQYNKRLECQRLQQPHYDGCMQQIGPSYEVYKEEKEKINSEK